MDGRCFTITLQRYKKYFEYTTKDAGLYPAKQTKQSSALTSGEEDGVGTSLQDRNALGAFNLPLLLLSPLNALRLRSSGTPDKKKPALNAGSMNKV